MKDHEGSWYLRRAEGGKGWVAHVELSGESDGGPKTLVAIAKGATKHIALHDAALMAERILNNPWMQSVMPPGSVPILRGLRAMARFGMSPRGKRALKFLKSNAPKAIARLAHFLHF